MDITFNMLLGHLGKEYPVIAAHNASVVQGFSNVRIVADGSARVADSPQTLYVIDGKALAERPSFLSSASYSCICTESYEEIADVVPALPDSLSWVAVDAGGMACLMNGLLRWTEAIASWNLSVSLILAHGSTMQELVDVSEEVVGLPLAVCGPLYADFAFTRQRSIDDPFFAEIARNGSLAAESVEKLEALDVFGSTVQDRKVKVFEPNGLIGSWHMNRHFHAGGKRVFFATAWCPDGKPDPGTVELFDAFARAAYSLYQAIQRDELGHFGQREQALYELICGDVPTRESASDIFRKLGISDEGLWLVAVLELDEPDRIPKAYHAYQFQKHNERSLTCIVDDEIVTLMPADSSESAGLAELDRIASQQRGRVGLSSLISSIEEVQTAHKQARFAIRMGSRISQGRVLERELGIEKAYPSLRFDFDDYLFHELLDHYPLGARGVNPGKKPIYDLLEYDRSHETHKTGFLYTYLSCNGSTGETAKRMGIHRNSVGYQVKSIESILGVDVHDLDFICHAKLAFASMEVFGS